MKVQVFDNSGNKVKEISAPKEIFATPVNEHLIYEAVINYRANQRQGTASPGGKRERGVPGRAASAPRCGARAG